MESVAHPNINIIVKVSLMESVAHPNINIIVKVSLMESVALFILREFVACDNQISFITGILAYEDMPRAK